MESLFCAFDRTSHVSKPKGEVNGFTVAPTLNEGVEVVFNNQDDRSL